MKAVVTGGAGFIGSHLAEGLLEKGYEVSVVDNLATGKAENIARIRTRIEFLETDINDREALARAFTGASLVFHVAAIPGVPLSIEDPTGTRHANLEGTIAVLECAKSASVKRVIFSSSAAVYGNTSVVPTPESAPTEPISPYGEQKLESEKRVLESGQHGLETVILRYFNVFGPRQSHTGGYAAVIPIFISLMKSGKAPTINGDGTTTRDFTYVADVAAANILAATAPSVAGGVFNIASGEQLSLNRLVDAINAGLGTNLVPERGPFREGDIRDSGADISKARKMLGYEPAVNFEEGILKTIASMGV